VTLINKNKKTEDFIMSNENNSQIQEQKLKTLQMYHAAALADSVLRYGSSNILDAVTKQKKDEQMKAGGILAERFKVKEPCDAFTKTAEIYGCADWVCQKTDTGFTAKAARCMLCSISKQMGKYSPCAVYCLSPIEAMIKGIAPESEFKTESTLWEGDNCTVHVKLHL